MATALRASDAHAALMHPVAPTVSVVKPDGHGVHVDAKGSAAKDPCGHGMHADAPLTPP